MEKNPHAVALGKLAAAAATPEQRRRWQQAGADACRKLSAAQKKEIRRQRGKTKQVELAAKYGVSQALICLVMQGKR